MRLFTALAAAAALLSSTVLADIAAAITTITADTVALNDTVASWDGNLLGALPITVQSAQLLSAIDSGTRTAKQAAPLTDLEAFSIAGLTSTLAQDVASTLDTIVAAKPHFDHLLLSPAILLNLQLEKKATDDFSAAVVEKVPEELRQVASSIVAGIDASFDKAIGAYKLF